MKLQKFKDAFNRMIVGVKDGEITLDELQKFVNQKIDELEDESENNFKSILK